MEERLRANDHKGGWGDSDCYWLLKRLRMETKELSDALWDGPDSQIQKEAADVANFAMMIADNVR